MKKYNLNQFTRGWLIGDFEPSILQTKDFEFMVRFYKKGEVEQKHVHKVADEVTVVVKGVFLMNNEKYIEGDIIHLSPGDTTDFICLEDGVTAVVKTPSVIGDKYIL